MIDPILKMGVLTCLEQKILIVFIGFAYEIIFKQFPMVFNIFVTLIKPKIGTQVTYQKSNNSITPNLHVHRTKHNTIYI